MRTGYFAIGTLLAAVVASSPAAHAALPSQIALVKQAVHNDVIAARAVVVRRPAVRPAFRPVRPVVRPAIRPGRAVVVPGRPFIRPGWPIVTVRPWIRRPYYGAIIAGVALGTIITVAAVGYVPPPPAPNLCWYWVDPSGTRGYWDYCQ